MKPALLFLLLATAPLISDELLECDEKGDISFNALAEESSQVVYPPRYEECFNNGTAKLRAGQVDEAITWLLKAIKTNPNSPQPYFNLGIAYESKENI